MRTRVPGSGRRPRSSGALLERDGPQSLGEHLARLADGALIDSRVLLAHHAGPATRRAGRRTRIGSPRTCCCHERVADPWLRALTRPRRDAPIPSCSAATRWSDPGCDSHSARAADGRGPSRRPPPRSGTRPRARRRGRRARRTDPRRDPLASVRCRSPASWTSPCTTPRAATTGAPEARPGRGGDFLTAPELHPIFGETLAAACDDIWERPGPPGPVRRAGARRRRGRARGARSWPRSRRTAFAGVVRYQPVEVDPRRPRRSAGACRGAGRAGRGSSRRRPARSSGWSLANEVLDALPVHRVRQRGDRLVELAVDVDGDRRFVEAEIAPTTPALAARLAAEGVVARRRPDRRDLPRRRRLGRRGRRRPRPRRRCCSSTTAPRRPSCTTRSGAGTGRCGRTSATRSTTIRCRHRRPAGPHRARRRDRGHPRRRGGRPDDDRGHHAGRDADEPRRSRPGCRRPRPTRRRARRPTCCFAASLMRLLDPAAMGRFRVMAYGRGLARPTAPESRRSASSDFRLPARDPAGPEGRPRTRACPYCCAVPAAYDDAHGRSQRPRRRGAEREPARALGAFRPPTHPSAPRDAGPTPDQSGSTTLLARSGRLVDRPVGVRLRSRHTRRHC